MRSHGVMNESEHTTTSPVRCHAGSRLPASSGKLGYETFGTADVFLDGRTQDYLIKNPLLPLGATC